MPSFYVEQAHEQMPPSSLLRLPLVLVGALILAATGGGCTPEPSPPQRPTVVTLGTSSHEPTMTPVPPLRPLSAAASAALLEILEVDDEPEPFRGVVVPPGVILRMEHVAIGPGDHETRHYAVLPRPGASDLAASLKPFRDWLAGIEQTLPEGRRLALERVSEEGQGGVERHAGWRTLVVIGDAVLTRTDVVGAEITDPWRTRAQEVSLRLSKPATERFREFTRRHVKRRLAILIDGEVMSAPVIQEEIRSGQLQLTFPATWQEQTSAAERLVERLR